MLKCNVVRTGQCWLDAGGTQWRLEAGDCFLVAPGHAFVLGSDLSLPSIPAEQVFAGSGSAPFARLDGGAGDDFRSLGGRMELSAAAELRMALATRLLAEPGSTVAEVAEALGYSSESAFGAAYRRATGHSPRGQRISR